jgi:hypothetical protein
MHPNVSVDELYRLESTANYSQRSDLVSPTAVKLAEFDAEVLATTRAPGMIEAQAEVDTVPDDFDAVVHSQGASVANVHYDEHNHVRLIEATIMYTWTLYNLQLLSS